MNFRVGQKVVCVDDQDFPFHHCKVFPQRGIIYTVRGINPADYRGPAHLWLEEIHNPLTMSGEEYSFHIRRFRPLVTRKTSIEIFERMLTPDLEKVRA